MGESTIRGFGAVLAIPDFQDTRKETRSQSPAHERRAGAPEPAAHRDQGHNCVATEGKALPLSQGSGGWGLGCGCPAHLVLRVPGADEQQLQRAQVAQALARGAHDLVQEGLAQLGEHTAVVEHPGEGQGSDQLHGLYPSAGQGWAKMCPEPWREQETPTSASSAAGKRLSRGSGCKHGVPICKSAEILISYFSKSPVPGVRARL